MIPIPLLLAESTCLRTLARWRKAPTAARLARWRRAAEVALEEIRRWEATR